MLFPGLLPTISRGHDYLYSLSLATVLAVTVFEYLCPWPDDRHPSLFCSTKPTPISFHPASGVRHPSFESCLTSKTHITLR